MVAAIKIVEDETGFVVFWFPVASIIAVVDKGLYESNESFVGKSTVVVVVRNQADLKTLTIDCPLSKVVAAIELALETNTTVTI